jgi:hypothetical protein
MNPADLLYVVIPLLNSSGNILLKLSVNETKNGYWPRFILMQFAGYITFIVVLIFSYMFLMTHKASLFVLILSLNYLATIYMSRWFLERKFICRDMTYDALIVAGIFIFYWGSKIGISSQ